VHIEDTNVKLMMKNTPIPFYFLFCKHVHKHYDFLPLYQQPVFRRQKEFILSKEYCLQPDSSDPEIQQRLLGLVLRTCITSIDLFYRMGLK